MTNHERKRLLEAYTDYVETRLSVVSSLIVVLVGFSLGTLSVTKISSGFNIFLMAGVLFFFLWVLLRESGNRKNSGLWKVIEELEGKYKGRDDGGVVLEEIRQYNVWESFSPIVVGRLLPILFAVLFCIYTLVEHVARALSS
ncbi:RipA family octameric membrane protein [Pseudomonas zeae]|uniref:Uncharacterized protein n=1 Tax=Pseudomonas zeae TaxID=2745510 RepID=A0A9E6NLZ4_9PSED|nr:hypothetical protein [Pseudomonas zeae]QXI10588.1 hypothetical protein HU754_022725 [Pseudomonas zeae]